MTTSIRVGQDPCDPAIYISSGSKEPDLQDCQNVILSISPKVIQSISPKVIQSILPNVILSGVEGWRTLWADSVPGWLTAADERVSETCR